MSFGKNTDSTRSNPEKRKFPDEMMQKSNEILQTQGVDRFKSREIKGIAPYHQSLIDSRQGFMQIEAVFDQAGKPYDYRLIEANEGAEQTLGMDLKSKKGKTVLQLFPDIDPERLEILSWLAISRDPIYFEKYNPMLNKWLSICAFSAERGRITLMLVDISERIQSEQKARESEQRLKRSQEIAQLGSWEIDLTSKEVTWSDETFRIFGLEPGELDLSYEAFLSFVHPEDRAAVDEAYSSSIKQGKNSYQIEHRIVQKNTGEIRHVLEKCHHLKDANRRIVSSQGMVLDITERKQFEEELHRSQKRLKEELKAARHLQRISMQLIQADDINSLYEQILDTAMAVMHADFASIQMYHPERGPKGELQLLGSRGFSRQAAESWKWVSPDSPGAAARAFRTGKRIFVRDVRTCDFMAGSDDQKISLETGIRAGQTTPLFSRSGAIIGTLSTHWREPHEPSSKELRNIDVLARQAADLIDRRQAEESLRISEKRFRMLMSASSEVLYRMSPDWSEMRQLHSRGFLANTENPKRTWIEQNIHPDDEPRATAAINEAIRTKSIFELEHRVRRVGNKFGWAFSRAVPVLDANGEIIEWIGAASDITERKQSEEALRELNESLELQVAERTMLAEARSRQLQSLAVELIEAEERERQRIAQILHEDLQQILAAARFQLQTSSNSPPTQQVLSTVVQLIDESIAKSRSLSHDLSPPMLNHFGMVASLEWLAKQMGEKYGLRVQMETDEMQQQVGDTPLQVFIFRSVQEFLFNVVKHAGVQNARVVLSRSNGDLAIEVSDGGKGFDPTIIDAAPKTTGLGLLSLRERANYLGGSLAIKSTPGHGSSLILRVPLNLDRDKLSTEQQLLPAEHSDLDVKRSIRILFADDHEIMRQGLIRLIAGRPNIEVVGEASNGLEAVEQARQLRPDVIIMDVSMPKMDGIEATRKIKAELPEIRVIGLSMFNDESMTRTMCLAGAEAFLSKTASPDELIKAIHGSGNDV